MHEYSSSPVIVFFVFNGKFSKWRYYRQFVFKVKQHLTVERQFILHTEKIKKDCRNLFVKNGSIALEAASIGDRRREIGDRMCARRLKIKRFYI